MEKLVAQFIEGCKKGIEEMLKEDSDFEFCEEIYSKYRSILLMIDMVKVVSQGKGLQEELMQKMKDIINGKTTEKNR